MGDADKMFELVEIELTRVRRMAEQTSDDLLLYMIDMAIIEANAKARASSDSLASQAPNDCAPLIVTSRYCYQN